MGSWNTALAWMAAACGAAWLGMLAIAYAFEHRLLFGRPRVLRTAPAGPHQLHLAQPVRLERDRVVLEGMVTRPVFDAFGANGTTAHTLLLWFGGRNEDVRWTPAIAGWLGAGHAVAAFAYRHRPSQAPVLADALHALAWLREEPRFEGTRLVLAGRSLGSAVALQVAAALPPGVQLAGLVLVSPMDSVRAMVAARPWLKPLARRMRSPFDSLRVAHAARCPVLVVLAQHDARVPHDRSMRLVEQLRRHAKAAGRAPVEVLTIPGTDHRTVARSALTLQAIAQFADQADHAGDAGRV